MKISVICPVFNSSIQLEKTINSVICQSFNNWELILVDDGSTDCSFSICKKFEQQYSNIKVIQQKNSGPFVARLNGINKSTGDYILFLDSDDFYHPLAFEKIVFAINSSAPDILMFDFFDYYNGKVIEHHNDYSVQTIDDYRVITLLSKNNCIWNKCYKKNLFDQTIPAFENRMGEDLILNLYLADKAFSIEKINESLIYYNHISSSLCNSRININKIHDKLNYNSLAMLINFSKRWSLLDRSICGIYFSKFYDIITVFFNLYVIYGHKMISEIIDKINPKLYLGNNYTEYINICGLSAFQKRKIKAILENKKIALIAYGLIHKIRIYRYNKRLFNK